MPKDIINEIANKTQTFYSETIDKYLRKALLTKLSPHAYNID